MTDNLLAAIRFSEEIRVANSRFIATISPAFTIEEAKLYNEKEGCVWVHDEKVRYNCKKS